MVVLGGWAVSYDPALKNEPALKNAPRNAGKADGEVMHIRAPFLEEASNSSLLDKGSDSSLLQYGSNGDNGSLPEKGSNGPASHSRKWLATLHENGLKENGAKRLETTRAP